MRSADTASSQGENFGFFTRALAGWCHDCRLCSHTDRDPDSTLERLMEWHRGWCPAWAARTRVYGAEDLSPPTAGDGTRGGN